MSTLPEPTGLARIALLLVHAAQARGLDGLTLLRQARLDPEALADPDARIPRRSMLALWTRINAAIPDPTFGLRLGMGRRVADYGLVGYTLRFSRTLGESLERLARYDRLIAEWLRVEIRRDASAAVVTVRTGPGFETLRQAVDSQLASLVSLAREVTQSSLVPIEVRLPYHAEGDFSEHRAFFRAPLTFEARDPAVILRPGDLDRPNPPAEEALTHYLDELAHQALDRLDPETSFAARVRQAISVELGRGRLGIATVSRHLHVSPRSLQRRLHEEGMTWESLLASLRQETAELLLGKPDLSVAEVACLLGYSDSGAFIRAFRRWRGVPPSAFRHAARVREHHRPRA